jgi:hypothetical protein
MNCISWISLKSILVTLALLNRAVGFQLEFFTVDYVENMAKEDTFITSSNYGLSCTNNMGDKSEKGQGNKETGGETGRQWREAGSNGQGD